MADLARLKDQHARYTPALAGTKAISSVMHPAGRQVEAARH